ncbi:MAG TPA: (Fe-S)-binding protein [Burkholderiaceae bacterium]|nr:(Fe-S)-binding protein [Burkholderiaceae bacterium]
MSASFERGVDLLREVMDAPTAAYLSSCMSCGLCAHACLFYTETGDPKYTPIRKLEPLKRLWRQEFTLFGRLARLAGLARPLADADFARWSELVYDSCTLCGRCSMVCPVGNDIAAMIRKIREGLAIAGHAPKGLVDATRRTIEQGSPMGIKPPAFLKVVQHQRDDSGAEIPVDRAGSDYLVVMSSMEIVGSPEYLGALAKIFRQAGLTWTVSSTAYEATNSGIQIGVSDLAKQIVSRIVDAAETLGVKFVVSPECGHAYSALRWEGPNLIGRPYKFRVVHVLELIDELRRAGKLRTKGTFDEPVALHDPCQIVRRGGVVEQPGTLLKAVASKIRETEDQGMLNWCCCGGGGVSANHGAEALRIRVFTKKKSQIEKAGVAHLVTPCGNCRNVIEEALDHYGMKVEVHGLTELVGDHLDEGDAS